MEERWLPIAGYGDRYEVSDFGRVRSLFTRSGPRKTPHILCQVRDKQTRYLRVTLSREGVKRPVAVHPLVLKAFAKVPLDMVAPVGRHLDGSKDNNHLSNLAWGTSADNHMDSRRHGTAVDPPTFHGIDHPQVVLTEADVREIRAVRNFRGINRVLGEAFGVHLATIHRIRAGKIWAHLGQSA